MTSLVSSSGAQADIDDKDGLFEELVSEVYADGYRLALGVLGTRAGAEDAVQSAVLNAWRRFDRFDRHRGFRPWFLAIVANECRAELRRPWRRVRHLREQLAGEPARDPLEIVATRQAMARLDAGSRLVLMLRYYLDLDYEAVAAGLGVNETTARARVSRAVRRLRALIGAEADG